MTQRPLSITLISWFIVLSSLFGMFMTFGALGKMVETGNFLAMAIIIIGPAVAMLAAFAMLMGQNWARFLYVAWSFLVSILPRFFAPQGNTIAGVIVLVIIYIFLFLPKANYYFNPKKEVTDQQN